MHARLFPALGCALALTMMIACARNDGSALRGDSVMAGIVDSQLVANPMASDGSFVIRAPRVLQEALHTVAESFGGREAVRVSFVLLSEDTLPQMVRDDAGADLVVASANEIKQAFPDSLPWILPFAEIVPEIADSLLGLNADTDTTAPVVKRSTRRLRGRQADSARADSIARADSLVRVRAQRDSARLLVLTMPAGAKNLAVAERFVRYLLTIGRDTLLKSGARVLPQLVLHGNGAPSNILSIVDSVAYADSLSGRSGRQH